MIASSVKRLLDGQSWFVIFIYITSIFFNDTRIKYIWGIEGVATAANIGILLVGAWYTMRSLSCAYDSRIWHLYIFPCLLILVGYLINFTYSLFKDESIINQIGFSSIWLVYLSIPRIVRYKELTSPKLLAAYYYTILAILVLSIIEYHAINSGYMSGRMVMTPYGNYYAGYFSLLLALDEYGVFHHRLYACFGEPGTLAMFIMAPLSYALVKKRYLAALFLVYAIYLTDSLGGIYSMILMLAIYLVKINKNPMLLMIAIVSVVIYLLDSALSSVIVDSYSSKLSRYEREDNIISWIVDFPEILNHNPFGLQLKGTTEEYYKNTHYHGSTFTLAVLMMKGGVFALIGYSVIMLTSAYYALIKLAHKTDPELFVVSSTIICVIPFVLQRGSLWESMLFPLIFSPYIIRYLDSHPKKNYLPGA